MNPLIFQRFCYLSNFLSFVISDANNLLKMRLVAKDFNEFLISDYSGATWKNVKDINKILLNSILRDLYHIVSRCVKVHPMIFREKDKYGRSYLYASSHIKRIFKLILENLDFDKFTNDDFIDVYPGIAQGLNFTDYYPGIAQEFKMAQKNNCIENLLLLFQHGFDPMRSNKYMYDLLQLERFHLVFQYSIELRKNYADYCNFIYRI